MKLSSFTGLGFEINAVQEACPKFKLSMAEVHDSAERGMLVEDLAESFGDKADFSLLLSDRAELEDVDLALATAAESLQGREERKVGVKNGLGLAMALILEAIQQQFVLLDDSVRGDGANEQGQKR